jgi:hypothetical protein
MYRHGPESRTEDLGRCPARLFRRRSCGMVWIIIGLVVMNVIITLNWGGSSPMLST